MKSVSIQSLGRYLPKRKLTNFDLEKMVDTTDAWIRERTGIVERRIAAEDEKTSDMAVQAARDCLHNGAVDPKDIDLIVVGTISPDSPFPSVACLVQKELGASKAVAFDVSAACSGFLYALITAKKFVETGMCAHALVIAAEKITNYIDWNDRGTCVLFGDGAGACLLTAGKDHAIAGEYMDSQGEYGELMKVVVEDVRGPFNGKDKAGRLPFVVMQGQELFKIAVNSMARAVEQAAERAGVTLKEIDCVVPHQANDRIIAAVAKKLGMAKDKIFVNIDKYGNMSAASIAVALSEAVEQGAIRKGSTAALVTFGAGLVSAACIVRW